MKHRIPKTLSVGIYGRDESGILMDVIETLIPLKGVLDLDSIVTELLEHFNYAGREGWNWSVELLGDPDAKHEDYVFEDEPVDMLEGQEVAS